MSLSSVSKVIPLKAISEGTIDSPDLSMLL